MTEEDAKTKWCPHAVASHTDPRAGFHDSDPAWPIDQPKVFSCIASACMAWRVRHQWLDNAIQEPEWVSFYPYAFEPGPGTERDDGYCGLAGAPQ